MLQLLKKVRQDSTRRDRADELWLGEQVSGRRSRVWLTKHT